MNIPSPSNPNHQHGDALSKPEVAERIEDADVMRTAAPDEVAQTQLPPKQAEIAGTFDSVGSRGMAGLTAGAAVGAVLGGPVGALVGGTVGTVAGVISGEVKRHTTEPEPPVQLDPPTD